MSFARHDAWVKQWMTERLTPALCDFVSIASKSRDFDCDWQARGLLLRACQEAAAWGQRLFPQARFEVLTAPGRTPALFFDIAATTADPKSSVFFYGHFDKQPEAQGWSQGLEPFRAVVRDQALYGRGAADDGYSFYAALTCVAALEQANLAHPRVLGLIETDEESGSQDFAYWLECVASDIADVSLGIVLDGTCCDYARLWATTSFRGVVNLTLTVRVLEHAIHSGSASGIVPDSFRIARQLLDRIEDANTGHMRLSALQAPASAQRVQALKRTADILGSSLWDEFPWYGHTRATHTDALEALIARSSTAQMCVVAAQGLPSLDQAARVLRPETSLALSVRIAPEVNAQEALHALTQALCTDPPYGADVTVSQTSVGQGWSLNDNHSALTVALQAASEEVFGQAPGYNCDGASIPILSLLQQHMPKADLLVTGVLGPQSNAHGPDEMLRLDYLEKLICALSRVMVHSTRD